MISINRRLIILLSGVLLTIITLALVAHTSKYDEDVLRFVSGKIQKINEVNKHSEIDMSRIAMQAKPFSNLSTTITLPKKITYDVNGPKSSQIAILTATDGGGHNREINNLTELVVENRNAYAKHHGYIHHFIDITKYDLRDVSPVWKKLPAVVETFNKYPDVQWVFWMDADAVIMTPSQDIQSLILSKNGMRKQVIPGAKLITETEDDLDLHTPSDFDFESVDLIIAQDWNGINAGTFLLRRSPFTQWMVDMWADPLFMYPKFERLEQDALRHMLKHHATMRQHTGIARQRSINAYPEHTAHQDPAVRWQQGDLLVHLAGCWVDLMCQEIWDEMWPKRGGFS